MGRFQIAEMFRIAWKRDLPRLPARRDGDGDGLG